MAAAKKTRKKPVTTTVRQLHQHKWLWLGVGLIAAVVDWLIGLSTESGGIGQNIWIAITLAAFMWSARQFGRSRKYQPTIRSVFYEGSGSFIKQLLIILFWIACLIPFLIGSFLVARIASPLFPASGLEVTIAIVVWVLLAVLSAFWIIRTIFAPVIVLDDTPGRAIKQSWRLTKRHVLRLSGYILGWFILLLIPIFTVFYMTAGGVVTQSVFVTSLDTIARGLIFVLVLPFMSVLIYQLYANESRQKPRR